MEQRSDSARRRAARHEAIDVMARFAQRTGLSSGEPQRYLWTDAFAVCNWLGLARCTGDQSYVELALRLVDQVHHVLGRHRPDDRRTGWISGLAADDGEARPTAGGLRIGKVHRESRPDEPLDEQLEWDRDGQYFHYLTKWMYALDLLTRHTRQLLFSEWARELAQAAHRAFVYTPRDNSPKRMYWKLSIDLSRPLVASMGQHDPLDGLVTYTQLRTTSPGGTPDLGVAIRDFAAMVDPEHMATGDPLGIGGLLVDAYRVLQLEREPVSGLLEGLLQAAEAGLRHYAAQSDLQQPAVHRLAFRELGLAIGLAALEREEWSAASVAVGSRIERLLRYAPLREAIESFWMQPAHREVASWTHHQNINEVMLATSLEPAGFLVIPPLRSTQSH